MVYRDCLEQLSFLPSSFPVALDSEVVVAVFSGPEAAPREDDLPILGITFDEQSGRVIVTAVKDPQTTRSPIMAAADPTKAAALKAALEATPIDQGVDIVFAWLIAKFPAEAKLLGIANAIIDAVLEKVGI